jgi:predicted RND superfamily exporter protein
MLGAVSMNLNIPYQLHRYSQKKKSAVPSEKDFGEVSFVSAATGILLMIGFLLLQFTDYASLAWIYILLVVAMIFLACLVGFCVATLIYVVLKNKFSHKQN